MSTEQPSSNKSKRLSKHVMPIALIGLGLLTSAAMIVASWRRDGGLTELELLLFQLVGLMLGLVGSYLFGTLSRDVPPNVRSACRRQMGLYRGLGRILNTAENRKTTLRRRANSEGLVHIDLVTDSLDIIYTQAFEHIDSASSAIQDWRDIAPDEVSIIDAEGWNRGH